MTGCVVMSRCLKFYTVSLFSMLCLSSAQAPPFQPNVGNYSFPFTTSSSESQAFFNTAMMLEYNFNQGYAQAFFNASARADPASPMPVWGLAYALGPFINYPKILSMPRLQLAYDAAQRAAALAQASEATITAKEEGLVAAMAVRYPSNPTDNQTVGYLQYRDALLALNQRLPLDDDVAALLVESIMDLYCDSVGYHFINPDGSIPADIQFAISLLQAVLARGSHPFARHLYIHITEQESPTSPDGALRAVKDAELLANETANTDSQHLQHMSGHTFLRVGEYNAGVQVNILAHQMDERFLNHSIIPAGPAHNMVFLIYCANMDGQLNVSYQYCDTLREYYCSEPDLIDGPGPEIGFHNALTARLRFGDWAGVVADAVVTPRVWPYSIVLKAMSRGIAFLHLHDYQQALLEYNNLQAAMPTVSPNYQTYAQVANWTLAAAIAWFASPPQLTEAMATLSLAVQQQTHWWYHEPPPFPFPLQQCLAQGYLEQQDWANADSTFRADLGVYPHNAYSLWGLLQAMDHQPQRYTPSDTAEVERQLSVAWARGQIKLTSACAMFSRSA